jgi:hypothetical protein
VTELVQVDVVNVTGQIPLKCFYITNMFTSTESPQYLLEPSTHPEDEDSTLLNNVRTFNNYRYASLNDRDRV